MSFRQSIEICLFLSFVVIFLIQENTCKSDSSSRDDPKPADAVSSSSPSRGNDVKFFLTKDDLGNVRGLLHPLEKSGNESPDIKDESGHAPERVYNLSPTNLEHLKCNHGQTAMFVLHPLKKETYVGCYNDKMIPGYCPEFNAQGVQPNYNAPCKITFTLCNASYQASEGYTFPKCFEIYGGISSPDEREKCTCKTPTTTPTTALLESEKSTWASPTPCPKLSVKNLYVIWTIILHVFVCVSVVIFFCKYCKGYKKGPNQAENIHLVRIVYNTDACSR